MSRPIFLKYGKFKGKIGSLSKNFLDLGPLMDLHSKGIISSKNTDTLEMMCLLLRDMKCSYVKINLSNKINNPLKISL